MILWVVSGLFLLTKDFMFLDSTVLQNVRHMNTRCPWCLWTDSLCIPCSAAMGVWSFIIFLIPVDESEHEEMEQSPPGILRQLRKGWRRMQYSSSQRWLHIRITWGTLKNLIVQNAPRSIKWKSLGLGPSHQYVLKLPWWLQCAGKSGTTAVLDPRCTKKENKTERIEKYQV